MSELNGGLIIPDVPFSNEMKKKRDEEYKEAARKKMAKLCSDTQKRLKEIDIKPVNGNVLIQPYRTDPYSCVIRDGILLTDDYMYESKETGNTENAKDSPDMKLIECGKVVEVAVDCKWLRKDDEVYYYTRNATKVPFQQLGMKIIPEGAIMIGMGKGLDKRLKEQYDNIKK